MDTSRDGGGEVYSWKLGRDGVEMGLTYDVSMTSMFITDWIFFFYKLLYQIPYESAKSINFKFDRKLFSQLFVFSSRINAISNVMAASNFIWGRWPNSKSSSLLGTQSAIHGHVFLHPPPPFHSIESADKRKEIIRSPWIS